MQTVIDPIIIAVTKAGLKINSVNYNSLSLSVQGEKEKAILAICDLGYAYHHGVYYRKGTQVISISDCATGTLIQYNKG